MMEPVYCNFNTVQTWNLHLLTSLHVKTLKLYRLLIYDISFHHSTGCRHVVIWSHCIQSSSFFSNEKQWNQSKYLKSWLVGYRGCFLCFLKKLFLFLLLFSSIALHQACTLWDKNKCFAVPLCFLYLIYYQFVDHKALVWSSMSLQAFQMQKVEFLSILNYWCINKGVYDKIVW